jgi:hypothetical protein
MWSHILRDQLQVDEEAFWACVRDKTVPGRGTPIPPAGALPAELVHLLLTRVGLSEAEVSAMTREQAIARLHAYWIDGV